MLRSLLLLLAFLALTGLTGCSDYPHEFEDEPLIIYDVRISDVRSSTATVAWRTNKRADTQLYYKTAASFERALTDDAFKLDHEISLEGLVADRVYYVSLKNRGEENDQIAFLDGLSFETPAGE